MGGRDESRLFVIRTIGIIKVQHEALIQDTVDNVVSICIVFLKFVQSEVRVECE